MTKVNGERERLSIDVLAQEHQQIKIYAAMHAETIREYVLKSVRERLKREAEEKELLAMTGNLSQDPALRKLWDNEKDSAYDKL